MQRSKVGRRTWQRLLYARVYLFSSSSVPAVEHVDVPLAQLIPDITIAAQNVNVIPASDLEHIKDIGVGGFAVVFKGSLTFIDAQLHHHLLTT